MTHPMRFSVVLFLGLLVMSFARCGSKAPEATKNPAVQEIKVTVKGEYSPDRIVVPCSSRSRVAVRRKLTTGVASRIISSTAVGATPA